MRTMIGLALTGAAVFAAAQATALEKTTARAIDRGEDWSASTTGTARYYNNCTGWVWVWSGWSPGERVGTNFDFRPCPWAWVNTVWHLTFSGVPSGYGFTGTEEVTVGGCGTQLGTQPYLPPVTSSWNATSWGGLPAPPTFSVNVRWAAPSGFTNPTGLASDHPLAGPTGPAACGTCYPTTRVSHSRSYGADGVYCPSGITVSDGLCDVEWMLEVNVKCWVDWVGIESESWGKIKSLYR